MNKKNWLFVVVACVFSLTAFNSCKKDKDDNTTDNGPTEWVKASAFDGDPRSSAASFQIGDVGYLATGILTTNERTKDAWTFKNNLWSRIKEFGGEARNGAVGFSIDGKGYMGTGFNGTDVLNDFWQYDPATNEWTKIADFPGEARYGAVAFTLDGIGYVGTGATKTQKTLKDFYKYDPKTNTWTSIESPLKNKRVNAFAFVVNGKAYVGGGMDNNQFPEDFYSFDGKTWNENVAPLKDASNTYDLTRQSASTFVIGNFGYVVGGKKGSVLGNVWKYDVAANKWESKHQALPQNAREGAVSFSIGGKGYLTTGMNSATKFDDTWVFTQVR
ncbi:Kelch repeat-containing protein [Sphingobacterium yanglingense]|uniref:Galactose oxidase-like protein n=1 Tax=Sphingobacterium yanglingense TaxID=1437280 RepID=A0A4R6WDP0_9SPHI|nr:kelch repeat-containing protein [Sphingobacterium yanglingense]TDQ75457.1 galactose oxidase-like protein [Sphingobacterium yanglingense]